MVTSPTIKAIKSFKAVAKGVKVHHVTSSESRAELNIFGTQGNCLGDPKIVDFEAPCHHSVGVRRLISDETVLPSTGKNCGGLGDTLGIVAVGLMKQRRFANRPVYKVSLFVVGILQRRNISFYRSSSFNREIGRCRGMNGLTADHQQFVLAENGSSGSDGVIERLAVHAAVRNDL